MGESTLSPEFYALVSMESLRHSLEADNVAEAIEQFSRAYPDAELKRECSRVAKRLRHIAETSR